MNKKILVLGAGNIGSVIARELAKDNEVTILDKDTSKASSFLKQKIQFRNDDISLFTDFNKYDLVVGALPSKYGYETLKRVIESGTNVVDVSFFNEDPFELDELAKKHSVKAIVDCGFAPGMSNIFVGHFTKDMEKIIKVNIKVGGLPKNPEPPWNYKANWCASDIIEEFTRPARIIWNCEETTENPLDKIFFGADNKQYCYTDGLRTLLNTVKSNFMTESTYRYTGFLDNLKVLRDLDLLNDSSILDKIKDQWKIDKDFRDISLMDIHIYGDTGTRKVYLKDEYQDNTTSMARLTGYTAVIACKTIDMYDKPGIIPPEYLGMDDKIYNFFREEWDKYNIKFDIIGE